MNFILSSLFCWLDWQVRKRAIHGRKPQGSKKEQVFGLYCTSIVSGATVHVVKFQMERIDIFPLSSRGESKGFFETMPNWMYVRGWGFFVFCFLPSARSGICHCQKCIAWRIRGLECVKKIWDSCCVLKSHIEINQRPGPTPWEWVLCSLLYYAALPPVHTFHIVCAQQVFVESARCDSTRDGTMRLASSVLSLIGFTFSSYLHSIFYIIWMPKWRKK